MGAVDLHDHQHAVVLHQNYQKMSRSRSTSFMIPRWLRLKSSKNIGVIVEEMKYNDDDDDAVSSSSSSMVTSTSSSSSSSDHSKNTRRIKNMTAKGGTEPASPRIGCMGQIKQQQQQHKQKQKKKNWEERYSKIDEDGIFLTTNHHHQHTISAKINNNNGYFKLKNMLFSATGTASRSNSFRFSTTTTTTSTVTTTGRSNSTRAAITVDRHRNSASKPPMNNEHHHHHHHQKQLQIDILELDPPLPVVKRTPPQAQNSSSVAQEGEEEIVIGDLWRRRRFGDGREKTSLKGLQLENPKHRTPTFQIPLPLTL